MAKDVTTQPWVFDATGQGEGIESDATGKVFGDVRIFIKNIAVHVAGTAGAIRVRESSTGIDIVPNLTMVANSVYTQEINDYVGGIYIATLPASAKVYVYNGEN